MKDASGVLSGLVLFIHLVLVHAQEEVHFRWLYPNPSPNLLSFEDSINARQEWAQRSTNHALLGREEDRIAAEAAAARVMVQEMDLLNTVTDADIREVLEELLRTSSLAAESWLMNFLYDTGLKSEVVIQELRRHIPELAKDKYRAGRIARFLGYLCRYGDAEDHEMIVKFQTFPDAGVSSKARFLTRTARLGPVVVGDGTIIPLEELPLPGEVGKFKTGGMGRGEGLPEPVQRGDGPTGASTWWRQWWAWMLLIALGVGFALLYRVMV